MTAVPSEFLQKSDEELFRLLGRYELDQTFASQPTSDQDQAAAGRSFVKRVSESFRQSICAHPVTKKLLYKQEADISLALGMVMVMIVQVGVFSRPTESVIHEIAALAALLLRQGLAAYCSCEKEAGGNLET
ncbi:hypothetical protein [Bradyrhizobium sp. 2TAF24]|uniref:hypothetical protein n=1 Tax=Bradyrhizobium sp. 2TAF24 TaxID=3233011 RepID=UPI003F912B97